MVSKIKKVLYYNLARLPSDIDCIFGKKITGIVIFSLVYIASIIASMFLIVCIGKYKLLLLIPIFTVFGSLNSIIISNRPYLFCVDERPTRGLKKVLFILSGPFGTLKIGHLIGCLSLMIGNSQTSLITKNPPNLWRNTDNRFSISVIKYQNRLKGLD